MIRQPDRAGTVFRKNKQAGDKEDVARLFCFYEK